jgi:hypothetical protein
MKLGQDFPSTPHLGATTSLQCLLITKPFPFTTLPTTLQRVSKELNILVLNHLPLPMKMGAREILMQWVSMQIQREITEPKEGNYKV